MATALKPPPGFELEDEIPAPPEGFELETFEPPQRAPTLFDEFGPFANVPRSSEERALQTFQSGLPQGITPEPTEGILSAFGVTPESIPSGKGPVTIPLASVARAGVGIADYLSSFQGIQELVGSLTPAKLVVMAKWATDMASGAGHEAGTLTTLVNKPNKTLEDWQKISDATVNLTAMGLGAGHLGSKVGEGVTGVRAPIGRALIEPVTIGRQATLAKDLAKKLQEAEGFGDLPVIPATAPTAERQLGIPIPEGMFVQPGIPPLADAALREAMQKVIVPGQEGVAANALRMALEPPEILQVEPTRLAERIPGGGQAPYGRVSFMRGAEPPVPERTQNAIQRETETVLRDVREPEVPQEGAKPLPTAEVSAKAFETLEAGKAPTDVLQSASGLKPKFKSDLEAMSDADIVRWWNGLGDSGQRNAISAGAGPVVSEAKKRLSAKASVNAPKSKDLAAVEPTKVGEPTAAKEITFETYDEPSGEWKSETRQIVVSKSTIPGDKPWRATVFAGPKDSPTAIAHIQLDSPAELNSTKAIGELSEQLGRYTRNISISQPQPPRAENAPGSKVEATADKTREQLQLEEVERAIPSLEEQLEDIKQRRKEVRARYKGQKPISTMNRTTPRIERGQQFQRELDNLDMEEKGVQGQLDAYRKQLSTSKGYLIGEPTVVERSYGVDATVHKWPGNKVTILERPDLNVSVYKAKSGWIVNADGISVGKSRKGVGSIGFDTPQQAIENYIKTLPEAKPAPKAETPKPTETPGGDIVSKLESLKFKEGDEGLAGAPETLSAGLNLPHPEVLKAIGRSTWNTAIDIAIASIKAGRAVKLAIEDALSHIRKNAAGKFDEAQVKANLDYILRSASESKTYPVEGESVKMRKSAERATTSEMVPEPVQETIKTAPESFYANQSMKRVEDAVGGMSETELSGVPRDSNLYTAAKLEQARRLFERGENDAGYAVFVELEKEGTRLGQLINQFKLLKGTRPEEIVRVVNTKLQKEGKDPLTKPQETGVLDASKKAKDADTALDKATDEWRQNPTDANAAKAEKALTDANDAAVNLQRKISKFSPRSTASVLKSVLQGNLLTPISEVANIVGNMSFLPFRAMDRTIASGLDVIDSFLRKKPREVVVQPISGSAEALKGLGRGAKKIPDILLRGTGDVIKGETRAGLHPIRAWINQFAKNPEMPTTGGKLTLTDRLNLAIEGTLGVPAESMLRGLGAGDIAFREAAHARVVANELKLANVPKAKWSFAQKFPELFLDADAIARIRTETMAAIFQRDSKTLNLITGWLRGKGEWVDLLAATVAPYKLTPWNIVGEILSYNPLVAMAKTVKEAKAGNSRQAKLNAGKLVVGSLLTTTGWWLYKNGLMSPSLDQRDEAQKARVLAGEVMPPNHINLSGLKRKISGGDPAFKPGDYTVDVFRSGGLAGSAFYMTANIGRDLERQPETSGAETWGKILRESTLEQARFGMNQSFLSGVEGLLSAIREGNVDTYLRQWGNTVASIPFPNSMTVLSRATRDYKPDFRAEGFQKQVENIVRNRLGIAKLDDYIPLKRGLWGEPLPETPKDRNAIIYHFFDVFKNQQVTSDPVPLELYRLWRKTDDSRVIPSLVEKEVTFGNKTYPLTAAQQSRYAELVGKSRRRIVDAVVVNPNFHKLPDEAKVKILDQIYDAGLDQGKAMFWKEDGANLTPKPSRAGFVPAPRPELSVPGASR